MTYSLGAKSMAELALVDPRMIAVVKRAIQITTQDFCVNDGGRTAAEQHALYLKGATQKDGYKNKSNHQCGANGLGAAVDLVPWANGRKEFADWNLFYPIAVAMSRAAKELATPITWGGNWYEPMQAYGSDLADIKAAVERYKKRHPGPDFIDGPHFQLA